MAQKPNKYAIAIHGGAGVMSYPDMAAQNEAAYHAGLAQALDAGYAVLDRGGSSLDAVNVAVRSLEDNGLFNAGRGAAFNRAGQVELDAAIMNGTTLEAGAVAGVRHIRNPVDAARLVMEKSAHVLLIAQGAEEFAREQGMQMVPNEYFQSEHRRNQWEKLLQTESAARTSALDSFGTVGAVALDKQGHLAAATSTGGMPAKLPGRVGDSPLIGSGTYAHRETCAVSATGHGELFIRNAVAHDMHALLAYRKMTLSEAAKEVVHRKLKAMQAEGGIIAIDTQGNIALEFNSEGMFRGARDSHGRRETGIYR